MQSQHALDPKDFDTRVRPTDDFFAYVNNNWLKRNPIPADEARWGSFNVLDFEVQKQLKEILEQLMVQDDTALDATAKKLRDFYITAMNAAKLNALKIA